MRVTKATVHGTGGMAVVDVDGGRLPVAQTDTVCETIRQLLLAGCRRILLNLAGVNRIDRCGIGELLSASIRAARGGCEIRLIHVNPHTQAVLARTRLCEVLETYEDEASAISSFTGSASARRAPGSEYFVG